MPNLVFRLIHPHRNCQLVHSNAPLALGRGRYSPQLLVPFFPVPGSILPLSLILAYSNAWLRKMSARIRVEAEKRGDSRLSRRRGADRDILDSQA